MHGESAPLFSVLVVFNNTQSIARCLASILASDCASFEVIVVDNGSEDFGPEEEKLLIENKRVRLLRNSSNVGPAAARNIAARISKAEYLAFVDDDTVVDPLWLTQAKKVMDSDPTIGAVQCKLLLMNEHERFDYAGDYLSPYGFLVQRVGFGEIDRGQVDEVTDIFATKSAGMVIRRDVFEKVGAFDEDYFIYMEETDLCWRVWLSGNRVVFAPLSIVFHDFGRATKLASPTARYLSEYHGTKNYIATILKNPDAANLIRIAPLHTALWVGICLWHIVNGRLSDANYVRRAIVHNLAGLSSIWSKRRATQRSREVSDSKIMPLIMKDVTLTYLYHKLMNSRSGWRPE